MAITSAEVFLNGTWHTLTYNPGTTRYEATVTAPGTTSWNLPDHIYPMQIRATADSGFSTLVTSEDINLGALLRLRVKETVPPTIGTSSPTNGGYVTNNRPAITFTLRDAAGGSGVNIASLQIRIDGGAVIAYNASGMVCTAVTGGYDCVYTPPVGLPDGVRSVAINAADYDGNNAAQATVSFTVDTVDPEVAITWPLTKFMVDNPIMPIRGFASDLTSAPVTVSIKLNGADQGVVPLTLEDDVYVFDKTIELQRTRNIITARATDLSGRWSEYTIEGICLITDRTQTDVDYAKTNRNMLESHKGMYNVLDVNRVGWAVIYIIDLMHLYGNNAAVRYLFPRIDWTRPDIPQAADMYIYLSNVVMIKSAFSRLTPLPATINKLAYQGANDIERLLLEAYDYLSLYSTALIHSGTRDSGFDMEGLRV